MATFFCLYWDFYWDWALFRSFKSKNWLLRDNLTFNPSFYYISMILNLIMRFWWVISIFNIKFNGNQSFLNGLQIMVFFSMLVEGIRRTLWSIIRVENEYHNNFE